MSYVIIKTDGTVLTTIPDGTINSNSTSIDLPGRLYPGYGQVVDTNFVHIMENFASPVPPENALQGQLWYNTFDNTLCVCPQDGETNALAWYTLVTSSAIANVVAGNLAVTGNITCNNLAATNNVDANVVTTNYLTVNVQANIGNANVTGVSNLASINTSVITTGATNFKGNLTGAWTVLGANTLNGATGTTMWVTGGNLLATGVKSDNWYYANGTSINFNGTYSNSNVAAYLPTYSGNVGAASSGTTFNGNTLTTGANTTAGTITGNWTLSAGSKLNGIPSIDAANITGTVANANYSAFAGNITIAAQSNITSLGTLTGLNVNGIVNAVRYTSNVATGIAPLSVLSTTVVANLNADQVDGFNASQSVVGSTVAVRDVNGNVSANFFVGNGSQLTGLNIGTISAIGNGTSNVSVTPSNGNVAVSINGTSNTAVFNSAGLEVTGNISAANISATNVSATTLAGSLTTSSQPNITSVGTLTSLTVSGNITGGNITAGTGSFYGNGSGLTNIPSSAIIGDLPSSDFATTAGTVITAAQPNITSTGTLTSVNSSGNITGPNIVANTGAFYGNASGLTNIPGANVTGAVSSATTAGTVTTASQPNITSVGALVSVTSIGNVVGTNVKTSTGAFYGNGIGLTNVPGANVTGTVASATYATSAGTAAAASFIPSGTAMLFVQTTAPTGWTKVTTYNDAALRVVSGAASSGGTQNFTAAFTSQAVSGTVGATTLTEAQMPSHTHFTLAATLVTTETAPSSTNYVAWETNVGGDTEYNMQGTSTPASVGLTSSTGSGQSHTHTFSGTNINLAVKYVDTIIATKD